MLPHVPLKLPVVRRIDMPSMIVLVNLVPGHNKHGVLAEPPLCALDIVGVEIVAADGVFNIGSCPGDPSRSIRSVDPGTYMHSVGDTEYAAGYVCARLESHPDVFFREAAAHVLVILDDILGRVGVKSNHPHLGVIEPLVRLHPRRVPVEGLVRVVSIEYLLFLVGVEVVVPRLHAHGSLVGRIDEVLPRDAPRRVREPPPRRVDASSFQRHGVLRRAVGSSLEAILLVRDKWTRPPAHWDIVRFLDIIAFGVIIAPPSFAIRDLVIDDGGEYFPVLGMQQDLVSRGIQRSEWRCLVFGP